MPDHSNDIRLALWKNDKREKPTQPILKGGKPVNINGQEYWLSAWINGPKDDEGFAHRIDSMVDIMADKLGSYPIVSISLTPAESCGYSQPPASGSSAGDPFDGGDPIPF